MFFVSFACWYGDAIITTIQVEFAPNFSDLARSIDSEVKWNPTCPTEDLDEPSLDAVQDALSNADDDSSLDVVITGRGGSISSTNFDHTSADDRSDAAGGRAKNGLFGNLTSLMFPRRKATDN